MIPVACKLIYRNHPEVNYKPGPFNLGVKGGAIVNIIAIVWTIFEVCILVSGCSLRAHTGVLPRLLPLHGTKGNSPTQIMPTIYPVTATNMVSLLHFFKCLVSFQFV